jgi:hypothetical protein
MTNNVERCAPCSRVGKWVLATTIARIFETRTYADRARWQGVLRLQTRTMLLAYELVDWERLGTVADIGRRHATRHDTIVTH